MIPTAWSVLFEGDRLPTETGRRIRQSASMDRLRGELRSFGDLSFAHATENAVEEALRDALDVSLLECLLPVWERHPQFPDALKAARDTEGMVLFGIGEHDVVSTHHPRIEVVGPQGNLASFEPELRLELKVQSATLRIDEGNHLASVAIGACTGNASLWLDRREIAASVRDDIRFPPEIALDRPALEFPSFEEPGRGGRHAFGAIA